MCAVYVPKKVFRIARLLPVAKVSRSPLPGDARCLPGLPMHRPSPPFSSLGEVSAL